jgi:hypothetical protein
VSNTPNQTLATVQDVIENLDDILCKMRARRLENDFDLGYERALNDVLHHLLEVSPELDCGCCTGCTLWNTSRSSTSDQMLDIVQDVVACTSKAFQKVRSCALESEFQLGYEGALNDLAQEVWALRAPQLAPNMQDDHRRNQDECDEIIEAALQELVAEGRVYDTGERRWSERTQIYQTVWGLVPPKHKQH